METLIINRYKGGVGASTIACIVAGNYARRGNKTLLVDACEPHTLNAMLGMLESDEPVKRVTENLDLMRDALSARLLAQLSIRATYGVLVDNYDVVVVDAGDRQLGGDFGLPDARKIGVVKNCYLALRASVKQRCDEWVCLMEPNRALNATDVRAVLGQSVTMITQDPAVARWVDAGVLLDRLSAQEAPLWMGTLLTPPPVILTPGC